MRGGLTLSAFHQISRMGSIAPRQMMATRWVHRPTREGSDDVHAAGRRVSTEEAKTPAEPEEEVRRGPSEGGKQGEDVRAEAIPCKIEKAETEAVMLAKEDAARSIGPADRCPIEMTWQMRRSNVVEHVSWISNEKAQLRAEVGGKT